MLRPPCVVCGGSMEGRRPDAKTCGDKCKKRRQRGNVVALGSTGGVTPPTGTQPGHGALVEAVERELTAAGRLESSLGQAARALAARIEQGVDTGSAVASLTKELRATLAEATKNAAVDESALDRVRRLRAERLERGA